MSARRITALALAVGAITALVAPTASARGLVEHEHFDESGSEDFTYCEGLEITHTWHFSGSYSGVIRGRDGTLHYRDSVRAEESWINEATGRSYSVRSAASSRDLKVVDNGDGTITITVQGSGMATYYDGDGNPVLRDPGLTRWQILVDTGGTLTDPSDDTFLEFLGVLLGSTGRNDTAGRDFCEDVALFTT